MAGCQAAANKLATATATATSAELVLQKFA